MGEKTSISGQHPKTQHLSASFQFKQKQINLYGLFRKLLQKGFHFVVVVFFASQLTQDSQLWFVGLIFQESDLVSSQTTEMKLDSLERHATVCTNATATLRLRNQPLRSSGTSIRWGCPDNTLANFHILNFMVYLINNTRSLLRKTGKENNYFQHGQVSIVRGTLTRVEWPSKLKIFGKWPIILLGPKENNYYFKILYLKKQQRTL